MFIQVSHPHVYPHVYTANWKLQHVSYKSAQGYAARIILLKTTLKNTVLVHITKLVLTMRFWLSAAFSLVGYQQP